MEKPEGFEYAHVVRLVHGRNKIPYACFPSFKSHFPLRPSSQVSKGSVLIRSSSIIFAILNFTSACKYGDRAAHNSCRQYVSIFYKKKECHFHVFFRMGVAYIGVVAAGM